MPLDQQSVLPTVRGLPWWGAVLVATVITGIGAVIDASNTDALGAIFKFCYLVGCVAAALAVRRRALFTAAAQPPLIAFLVGIIALYTLNADQASSGLKSLIFRVLLPIANAFPWMALTFLVTLALVVARWYLTRDRSTGTRRRAAGSPATSKQASTPKQRSAPKKRSTPTQAGATTATSRAKDADQAAPGTERRSRTTAKRAARPAKPRTRPTESGERTTTPGPTADAKPRRTPAPRPEADGAAAAPAAPAPKRRATAGAVYRAEAGERINGIDEDLANPDAQTAADPRPTAAAVRPRPTSAAGDHARYESSARQATTRQAPSRQASAPGYPSTRARNRG
ncbi:hypothetical protein EEB19_16930 [Gordonia sp. OPL2]|nr:hypothetical protein EEB19_16930 [Gordonia sp. OPL2]